MNTETSIKSSKRIAKWTWDVSPGIYEGTAVVTLYADRAIVRMPGVKWVGNTGGYHVYRERLTGKPLDALLKVARQQSEDSEDYTDRVRDLVNRWDNCGY